MIGVEFINAPFLAHLFALATIVCYFDFSANLEYSFHTYSSFATPPSVACVNHCAILFCCSLSQNEILTPGKSVTKCINSTKHKISSYQFCIFPSLDLSHNVLVSGTQNGTFIVCCLLSDSIKACIEVGSYFVTQHKSRQVIVLPRKRKPA